MTSLFHSPATYHTAAISTITHLTYAKSSLFSAFLAWSAIPIQISAFLLLFRRNSFSSYFSVSVTNFGALLVPHRWSNRHKKHIVACRIIGNSVLVFLITHYSKGIFPMEKCIEMHKTRTVLRPHNSAIRHH